MKILLVYPLDRDFMPPSMPPMGLAYIASTLDKAGHQVSVLDLNADRDNGVAPLKDILLRESFGMIGISSIITQFKRVKELGKLIKSLPQNTPLVMGGPGPTSIPELYIKNCSADVVCIGEGEETITELVSLLRENKPLALCKGIAYSDQNGNIIQTDKRAPIVDIDGIALPLWKKFKFMELYTENFLFRNGKNRGMSILSARGCPGHCNYCMCNFGRSLRLRSTESIFLELRHLVEDYAIKQLHFIDYTFVSSKKRVAEICHNFNEKFNGISWSANVRPDLVTPENLKQMGQAGCVSLAYGIESASQKILECIKKGISVKQAADAIRCTRDAGISLTCYFIIGMPAETPETVWETVDFCKENLVGGEFFFATPFPGTELYRYARENKIINDEELYLEHVGEVRDFLVNLTRMSNEELFKLKEEAEAEIKLHLAKYNIFVKPSIRKDPREASLVLPRF